MPPADAFAERRRLRALAGDPPAEQAYAVDLVRATKNREALLSALHVLARLPEPAARPALAARYDELAADPNKRDQGGHLRTAVVQALRPVCEPRDTALFERALFTYEILPTSSEDVTGVLRAAGLLAIADIDLEAARYHATRLLFDPRAAQMSGEPAVTAARLLGTLGAVLPIYGYVSAGRPQPEVAAECLRGLLDLPPALLADLTAHWLASREEIALVGLIDLLLEHRDGGGTAPLVRRWLDDTDLLDAYRYAVAAIVAKRSEAFTKVLLEHGAATRDDAKQVLLLESLALVETDPTVRLVTDQLRHPPRRGGRRPAG
jgi:hypothetical protein